LHIAMFHNTVTITASQKTAFCWKKWQPCSSVDNFVVAKSQ